jgi:hypothetical protein
MTLESDENEKWDQDYPATDSKPSPEHAGRETDESQLPRLYRCTLIHGWRA